VKGVKRGADFVADTTYGVRDLEVTTV
jgi:hypothetical protein